MSCRLGTCIVSAFQSFKLFGRNRCAWSLVWSVTTGIRASISICLIYYIRLQFNCFFMRDRIKCIINSSKLCLGFYFLKGYLSLWLFHSRFYIRAFCLPLGKIHLLCSVVYYKECIQSTEDDTHCLELFEQLGLEEFLVHIRHIVYQIFWNEIKPITKF